MVGLQEVGTLEDQSIDLLKEIADQVGLPGCFAGPTMLASNGEYGNAVLTRLEVSEWDRLDISVASREPRGALKLRLKHPFGTILLISTHLGLRPYERQTQLKRLLLEFTNARNADCHILIGDLNEWFFWGRSLRWLRDMFGVSPSPRTFPSSVPLLALDRIWTRPHTWMGSVRTHRSPLARVASDHLPLIADIEPRLR